MGSCVSQYSRHVPLSLGRSRDVDLRGITPLPSAVDLGLVLGETHRKLVTEEEASTHSHSPASSAPYSNLGLSRANMIPLKQPRILKSSNDTLASLDLDEPPLSKDTPPPLPKKNVPRSGTEPSLGSNTDSQLFKQRAEAKPGGTNLSVVNPLYDLDSTWDTASQSSSLSSEPHPTQDQESGDSLERPSHLKNRPVNSMSCLLAQNSAPRERKGYLSTECLAGRGKTTAKAKSGTPKTQKALYKGLDSWDEVVGRIRGLHADTLRKLAAKCEDRFMAGQKDHVRFGIESWSDFRLVAGKPCCEAGDAVYYTASYAKDPSVSYAIKICRSQVKETQQQFFHSLAVRQSLPLHFNIQQDCGHFLADVPGRLLPWEEAEEEEQEDEEEEEEEEEKKEGLKDKGSEEAQTTDSKEDGDVAAPCGLSGGSLKSRVVVITREVPFQTVADFVQEGVSRHTLNPELYERQVCLLLLQLCSGLQHMKPFHVTHCDLRLENLLLVHSPSSGAQDQEAPEPNNNTPSGCPARLIISNFSQAKQKSSLMVDPAVLRDQSRLAPEIITATQYRKCDEFQTGILIYEMLHRPNPFEEHPELKEREYTWADLPPLPVRSLYSQGLQRLARLLLTVNPSERIRMWDARACLQCLLWGPREDLFAALGCSTTSGLMGASHCDATLQNWLDLKRTLMMIKFAERSMDSGGGVALEDWLCCQYLAFASTESLSRVVHILQQPQGGAHSSTQHLHMSPAQL